MFFLSPTLKRIIYPSLAGAGYFRRRRARQISILTYHGVFPNAYTVTDPFLDGTLLTVEMFRRQLRMLRSSYRIFSPSEFLDWLHSDRELPERAVLLTCDDGLLNSLTGMVPVLVEEKLSCVFFVTGVSVTAPYSMLWYVEFYLMLMQSSKRDLEFCVDNAGTRFLLKDKAAKRVVWLDLLKKLSRVDGGRRKALMDEIRVKLDLPPDWGSQYLEDPILRDRFCVMGLPEIQRLVEAGMHVGAHTLTHPIPSQQPAEVFHAEIVESREILENALEAHPIWSFAYPFGDEDSVSPREFQMVERAGFQCAFVNEGGPVLSKAQPYALPRINISRDMSIGELEAHASGFHEMLRGRFRPRTQLA